ncbi:MAG: cohesin domain-containing protein [Candidatus Levyibacteriota bacterium]
MRKIPGKTLILIAVLVTVTLVLLGVAIWTGGGNKPAMTSIPTAPTIVKTATIAFAPPLLDLSLPSSSSATVDIITKTGGATPLTGAQVDITYDPTVVTNVKVLPPLATNSLFGPVGNYVTLFSDINTPGKITFAVAMNPNGTPVTGAGSIGQISFSVIRGVKSQTQMTFGARTLVTSKITPDSVLKSTTPLTIKIQ